MLQRVQFDRYRSTVRTAVLWPGSLCTTFTFAPELMANEAHVWRRSCNRMPKVATVVLPIRVGGVVVTDHKP
jgi:hypothetical protein